MNGGFVITQQMFNIAFLVLLSLGVILLLVLIFRRDHHKDMQEFMEDLDYASQRRQEVLKKAVDESIGAMRTLAMDMGNLKRIFGNVKTRGIVGEVQLGNILSDFLSPSQYVENVATVPRSSNRVEFAICLPSSDEGRVYLPIDSKFPADRYEQLMIAREEGNKEDIERAGKELEAVLKSEAKDIRSKYVEVPYTTNFGIMFLPSEGLYCEVINRGLLEKFQKDYQVVVTGPSTVAAFLNSLQMGFRTLNIEKRTNEVWQILASVKTEFGRFEDGLETIRNSLDRVNKEVEELLGARSRAINKKLQDVDDKNIH